MDNAKVEFLYMHSLRALPMKTTDTVLFSLKSSQKFYLNFRAKDRLPKKIWDSDFPDFLG